MNPASQKKLCFVAFYLYVASIVTALLLSYAPIDPLLCIGLKVLLLFLALFALLRLSHDFPFMRQVSGSSRETPRQAAFL